jgi:predicted lipopolysaccharide heptosyltransferase III
MMADQLLPNLPQNSKLLFIRLRSLGDTILATPLFAALKAWRPDLRIDVLAEAPHHEVLLGNPHLCQIFTLPQKNDLIRVLVARSRILRTLRIERYQACINLHGGSTSAWLTWLSRSQYRIGLSTFRNRIAYNIRLNPPHKPSGKYHTVEYFIDWLRQLGLPAAEIPPLQVSIDSGCREEIRQKLEGLDIFADSHYCVIQPASKFLTKQWPAEQFGKIAGFVAERYGMRIILTGSPNEAKVLRKVSSSSSVPVVILDNLSVRQLAGLLERASLFIGNDSGPTHLAAALQVPLVAIFGSSDSQVWRPWKAANELVQNPFKCNPCPGYKCLVYDEPRCILSITPDQVQTAIALLMDRCWHAGAAKPNFKI